MVEIIYMVTTLKTMNITKGEMIRKLMKMAAMTNMKNDENAKDDETC